ncbi:MAG TPA: DUF1579 family protein [Gemmatimonadales bacterium]|nr:DUF1579 family protein [Gemmatimonadales bacterium]
MTINAHRRFGYVAAGVLAIAAASASPLVAQGGEQANERVGVTTPVSLEPSHVAPARSMLRNLVGTWRFEIWFAGNLDGAPDASGTRVVTTLYDDLRLEWTEQLDHSNVRGQGMLGFDPTSDRFFSSSVYTTGAAPEFMTGVLDDAEPRVTFRPITVAAGASPSSFSILDQNHFTWVPLDRAWRATFTRQ